MNIWDKQQQWKTGQLEKFRPNERTEYFLKINTYLSSHSHSNEPKGGGGGGGGESSTNLTSNDIWMLNMASKKKLETSRLAMERKD